MGEGPLRSPYSIENRARSLQRRSLSHGERDRVRGCDARSSSRPLIPLRPAGLSTECHCWHWACPLTPAGPWYGGYRHKSRLLPKAGCRKRRAVQPSFRGVYLPAGAAPNPAAPKLAPNQSRPVTPTPPKLAGWPPRKRSIRPGKRSSGPNAAASYCGAKLNYCPLTCRLP